MINDFYVFTYYKKKILVRGYIYPVSADTMYILEEFAALSPYGAISNDPPTYYGKSFYVRQ